MASSQWLAVLSIAAFSLSNAETKTIELDRHHRMYNEVCVKDQWRCHNGRCISPTWLCDREDDCGDNSDEGNCYGFNYRVCSRDQWQCRNYRCISPNWLCDERNDCGDNSDESTSCPSVGDPVEVTPTVGVTPTSLAGKMLFAHNKLRSNHKNTPALAWDNDLAGGAHTYADYLAYTGTFSHSQSNGQYGENLYWYSSATGNPLDAVLSWYDEYRLYNYYNPGFSSATGHFTQIVWKATSSLGCGVSTGRNGLYVVCRYKEAGNVYGRFEENVTAIIDRGGIPTTVAELEQ